MTAASGTEWGALRPRGLAALFLASLRHRIARGVIKRAVARLLARLGPYYDVELDGVKFRCHVTDNLSELRIATLKHNAALELVTSDLKPGNTFVDIGANVGAFALYAAKRVGPTGIVLAIEPSPAIIERLRFNVRANGVQNVRIAPVAVGDGNGEATLHVVSKQHGRSSLYEHGRQTPYTLQANNRVQRISVPVEPLLSLLAKHELSSIDAMKIDIEGYEDRVLIPFFRGAPETLWPRRVLIERSSHIWKQDCIEHMLARGYRMAWQSKQDVLLVLPA